MDNKKRKIVFEPSGKRVGDYQLGQRLGAGGMGAVYLARQISMKRLVALKILHSNLVVNETSLQRFFREMRLSANVTGEGFARVYEAGREGSIVYFSMEFVEGRDLHSILRMQRHPFTEDETLELALFLSETMNSAWTQYKIVHRDIKPANIIRTEQGTYKVLDLGVSKSLFNKELEATSLTGANFMVGSPAYMSPEQASDASLDCRADIYSLGITMYQMLTGKVPYNSTSQFEVIAMHFKSPVPDVRGDNKAVSPGTARLLRKMLAKDRDDRPASWEELSICLRKLIARRNFRKRFAFIQNRTFRYGSAIAAGVLLCIIGFILFSGSLTRNEENTVKMQALPVTVANQAVEDLSEEEIARLREETLRFLLQQSGKYEANNEWQKALALWTHYTPPGALQNDQELKMRIREQIRYLQDQLP